MALIISTDQLREHVKINASKDFTTFAPYVQDAQDKYILPYFGKELITRLENSAADVLTIMLHRALAPFVLALATYEMSINFGEAGHTVTRTDNLAPASDSKIQAAETSLYQRGWENLDRAIKFVSDNESTYEEWQKSTYYSRRSTLLFDDADSFQENGLVFIDSSPLTMVLLRQLIKRVEYTEVLMFIPEPKRSEFMNAPSSIPESILMAMQAYTGSRVAAIHTSRNTNVQRSMFKYDTEYKPIIRPLNLSADGDSNYFESQAVFWRARIEELLITEKIISEESGKINFNKSTNKTFVAGANRSL